MTSAAEPKLVFGVQATAGAARAATVRTARGSFQTPVFMPVGTRGAVRGLDSGDLDTLGIEIALANTYHLMLRPGASTVAELGGLHQFTAWNGHFVTDSGGFQVFSLGAKVDDDGVTFKSVYDGSIHRFGPEDAVAVQETLGADIQMVLDECPALPAPRAVVERAMQRTLEWARRQRERHARADQCQFGIVQGGVETDLRASCAQALTAMEFDGYAIGGLSVGEPLEEMLPALEAATSELPFGRPRYLMGVGDPVSLVEGIARGIDMFDCVLPTRLARHGTVLTHSGRLQIRNARFAQDRGPLDPTCSCLTCARYSRGYLRHLLAVGEMSAARLLTIHNVAFLHGLVGTCRSAILEGTFEALRGAVNEVWSRKTDPGPGGR